jgi:hypothetical protein
MGISKASAPGVPTGILIIALVISAGFSIGPSRAIRLRGSGVLRFQ